MTTSNTEPKPRPAKKPKLPKLPKVWVEFADGTVWAAYYHRPKSHSHIGREVEYRLYAPVQKPRVCVWTPCMSNASEASYKDTGCGDHLSGVVDRFKFCPYCGGKIKVAKCLPPPPLPSLHPPLLSPSLLYGRNRLLSNARM